MQYRWLVVGVACLLAARPVVAGQKSFDVSGGVLHVDVPDGWSAESNGQKFPTIEINAPADQHLKLMLTAIRPPDAVTDAKLKEMVTAGCQSLADQSKEKKIVLADLKGDKVKGYVGSFTDASADPGEYPLVTSGGLLAADQIITLTLLNADKTSKQYAAAMTALKTMSVTAGGGQQAAANGDLKVSSADGKWSVTIPGNWQAADPEKHGKSVHVQSSDDDGGWIVSVFIEPAAKPGDAKAARTYFFDRMKKSPMPMKNDKKFDAGDVAAVEYDVVMGGFAAKNVNAYLSQGGEWVDVHISKPTYDEKTDRAALDKIVKGIRVDEPAVKK